jgi:hypothetical protein
MSDCNICCEKYNKSSRIKIECAFCNYCACRECLGKYTLESILSPHCMNCKKFFTKEFLKDSFTATFIKGPLKEHEESVIFDRENGLLIETMPYVELKKKQKENCVVIRTLEQERVLLQNKIYEINNEIYKIQDFNGRIINTIHSEQGINAPNAVQVGQNYYDNKETLKEKKPAKKFIRRCAGENCRGFLDNGYTCAVCEQKTCKDCNEIVGELHTCDPKNVENMELIKKDSKPCPECGEFTFRIEGCYMMWCTICHTTWDWKNGEKLETNNIHNPHYFDFLRKNGNALPTTPGGGNGQNCGFDLTRFANYVYSFGDNNMKNYLLDLYRTKEHIRQVEIPNAMGSYRNPIIFNRQHRLNFILNDIDEATFKKEIRENEKKMVRSQDFCQILNMFVNVCNDIYLGIYHKFQNENNASARKFVWEQISVLENLVTYFNECCKKHGKLYKVVYPGISENGKHYHKNYEKGIIA